MKKYFLDTTVLTELVLKRTPLRQQLTDRLKGAESEVPGFAIREFRAGPLSYWVWLHNKLVTTGSLADTIGAIHAISRTLMRGRTSTALEALTDSLKHSIGDASTGSLAKKHGAEESADRVHADVLRLHLRRRIKKGWEARRQVCTRTVVPLQCFQETDPVVKRGLLTLDPLKCTPVDECCLAPNLRGEPKALSRLLAANESMASRAETQRRGKALKKLIERPSELLSEAECRALGDALFAFFAPPGSAILTTNIKDHVPLAEALSKTVESGFDERP